MADIHHPPAAPPGIAAPVALAAIERADPRRLLPSPDARAAALPHHAAGERAAGRAAHHAALWAALEAAGARSYATAHGLTAAAEAGAAAACFIAAQKAVALK